MKYRIEGAYGSGKRKVEDVISYEILSLHNSDILDTLLSQHKLSDTMIKQLYTYSNELKHNGYIKDTETFKLQFVKELLFELSNMYHMLITHCLWLGEEQDVISLYGRNAKQIYLDCYKESDIILSDLGRIGILYGYNHIPEKLKTKTIHNT